ncbi:GldG family protein [Candidatus Entotheonella palauensis]|uniref:GldG family protein n=1 Tax=Candidatus Entotheonella palauensis TaxID=93172 RepID=UPI000B7CE77C|nr:GldG family protein [Candidatus Entotheonella palauensis]
MQTALIALLGMTSLLLGWILMVILPGIRLFAWGVLAFGGLLIAVAVLIDFRRVQSALISPRGKFGVSTTVMVCLFAGILVLVNAISVSHSHRFDFTGLAQFTLTSQTKEVLARLDTPVEIVRVFTPKIPVTVRHYAQHLLAEYRNYSDHLTVRELDPDVHPDQARRYGVSRYGAQYGSVVFRGEKGKRQVFGPQITAEAEHAFTSAILEVTGTVQKQVYFLTGHGDNGIRGSYSQAASGLRDNLFQAESLDLAAAPRIPEDAAVLVLAGPQQPLSRRELALIQRYLETGGRLFVLLNPNPPQALRQWLSAWWIDVPDGVVIDPASYAAPHQDHPLIPKTRNTFGLADTYFPGAAGLIPRQQLPENTELAALVWTSPESWIDTHVAPGKAPVFDANADLKGPIAIGALLSTQLPGAEAGRETRLVVMGDADFASNPHFHNGRNSDLFLSAVHWLGAGDDLISIDRKVLATRRLVLSPEEARFLNLSSIGLLPFLLLATGGYVWWRRR